MATLGLGNPLLIFVPAVLSIALGAMMIVRALDKGSPSMARGPIDGDAPPAYRTVYVLYALIVAISLWMALSIHA